MENIINKWTASKNTNEFNYDEALITLAKDKSLVNHSIEDYLHFDFSNKEIFEAIEAIEAIEDLNQEHINDILELVNRYSYYLEMNERLKSKDNKNIKKLEQLNKILDSEFIEFLDRYLELDKTILSSNDSLKIVDNYQDVIKYYLEYDFKFALNELEIFFNTNPIQSNGKQAKDEALSNSLLIKPKTKAYLKPIGERGILKCLYFDLLHYFIDLTKEQAIDIIKKFFDVTLQPGNKLDTLSAKAIDFIKNNSVYEVLKDDVVEFDTTGKIIKKEIPTHHIEIKEMFNLKEVIQDNFIPILSIKTPK